MAAIMEVEVNVFTCLVVSTVYTEFTRLVYPLCNQKNAQLNIFCPNKLMYRFELLIQLENLF